MSSPKKLPIIAIVGRANVGKSSLFNAILERREAIVADEAGTTRDSITAKATLGPGHQAWLVDTAGMKAAEDEFELSIQEQIIEAADAADIILVVIEANVAITEEDRRVAKLALKSRKPVFLVVNKADKARGALEADYLRLGIKSIFLTSTTQKTGLEELLNALTAALPAVSQADNAERLGIAFIGRPNVGKSYLFNTISKKQQAIVSDRAGTTRDVNRTIVRYQGKDVELMDTAGIRRSGKIERGVERFSVIRSLSAIEQSDICFLLMDANELNVALDQKIAGMIKEAGRGLVLVVSKWDAVEDKTPFTRDQLAAKIKSNFEFVPWAPLIFTSSVTGQNVAKLFEIAFEIDARRQAKIKTTELNRWLRQVVDKHMPAGLRNRQPKLNYIVQEENPIPSFRVYGAHTKFLHWSYKRFMERDFREHYDYIGSPIKFWFIEKHDDSKKPTKRSWKDRLRPEQIPKKRYQDRTDKD